jgi:hypothetical protein
MVARKTWAVIGGALGAVGIAGALGATAGEPRGSVDLEPVQITSTTDATEPAPTPEPDPTPSPTPTPSDTPSPAGTDDSHDDSDDGHDDPDDDHDDPDDDDDGPKVVTPPSPVTADTPD